MNSINAAIARTMKTDFFFSFFHKITVTHNLHFLNLPPQLVINKSRVKNIQQSTRIK